MSHSSVRRQELGFAIGNLVPATALGAGLVALPVRWWPADLVVGGALVALAVASSIACGRPALARRALGVAARVLLGIGLVLLTAAVLSMAFLAGIHGDFGRGGVILMLLVSFLVLPYAIVYPVVELWWLGSRTAAPTPGPRAEASSAAAEDAGAPAQGGG